LDPNWGVWIRRCALECDIIANIAAVYSLCVFHSTVWPFVTLCACRFCKYVKNAHYIELMSQVYALLFHGRTRTAYLYRCVWSVWSGI